MSAACLSERVESCHDVEEFLEQLIEKGLVPTGRANLEKGSTWVVEETAGKITGARYVAAP